MLRPAFLAPTTSMLCLESLNSAFFLILMLSFNFFDGRCTATCCHVTGWQIFLQWQAVEQETPYWLHAYPCNANLQNSPNAVCFCTVKPIKKQHINKRKRNNVQILNVNTYKTYSLCNTMICTEHIICLTEIEKGIMTSPHFTEHKWNIPLFGRQG